MKPEPLTEVAVDIIEKRGSFAIGEATQQIFQSRYDNGKVSEALKYYAKTIFPRVLPIFPALVYLSCKAVGGKPEQTKSVAAAMMLVTASGDIHDDIIDKSTSKFARQTVFGKYGKDITLLAGDVLLIQGMSLLQKNSESLRIERKIDIADLITESMFELAGAEASEICLWKKPNVTPEEYFEVIRRKGSVAELHCRIGAILGCADEKALDATKEYGRIIGILSTVKDEFLDLENFSELKHKINNEMLPYPMICAFQNQTLKKQLFPIISNKNFSKKDLPFVTKTILNSIEVKALKSELREFGEKAIMENTLLKDR
jgi:geranylgeranyl pyrophosphate synthase